jgi:hypothetical protein
MKEENRKNRDAANSIEKGKMIASAIHCFVDRPRLQMRERGINH